MSRLDDVRHALARATEEGAFGDVQFDSLIDDSNAEKGPQFMSRVLFVTMRLKDKMKKNVRDVPLVVKVQRDNETIRTVVKSDIMFSNEVCMYLNIIPELGADQCNAFAKCYYGRNEGDENFKNDIVVLEDLTALGYQISKHKIFLDLPHLLLALKKIGEFHGLSYKFKQSHGSEALRNKLHPTKFSAYNLDMKKPFIVFSTKKYGKALVDLGYDETMFDRLLDKYNNLEFFFKFASEPQEPFAVICHGDFNRNNFFYKYDSGDHPVDIKFFDLQNSVYGDPTLDLGFFLYMNTTQSLRRDHWDDFLRAYWDGVHVSSPEPGFTYAEFVDNFGRKAFLGFSEALFFLPMMVSKMEGDEFSHLFTMSMDEKLKKLDHQGGIEAFEAVRDVLKHLVDNRSVQHVL